MARSFDVAIAGLGAMGSAAAYNLARRGRRVIAFDRYAPPHAMGSSHGRTRIIREAYFEDPMYVPMIRRAYEAWEDLEGVSGRTLLRRTGGIMIGPEGGALVTGARASAEAHGVGHRLLPADAIRREYPVFQPPDDMVGIVEDRAGVLFVEESITAFLEHAARAGAELRANEPVSEWAASGDGVRVTTSLGEYTADRLIVAAGAWARTLVPDVDLPLRVARQVLHWFEPTAHADEYGPERCPISLWELDSGRVFYTLPDFGDGLKIGIHHEGETVADPSAVRRTVSPEEDAAMAEIMRRFLPRGRTRQRATSVCLYTNTPDSHFILDAHPVHAQVIVASPCSGQGFKFASVIGEILADVIIEGSTGFDLSRFEMRGEGRG